MKREGLKVMTCLISSSGRKTLAFWTSVLSSPVAVGIGYPPTEFGGFAIPSVKLLRPTVVGLGGLHI